jgi:hypothetical protein
MVKHRHDEKPKKPLGKRAVLTRARAMRKIERDEKAVKAMALKKVGFNFRKIAEQLGYNSPQAARLAVLRMLQQVPQLEYEDWMALHVERTEDFLLKLQKKILAGEPRAIEVAVKVLERQAALVGLDYVDRKETGPSIAPIQINIIADPRDDDAQRFIAEIKSRAGPAEITPVQRPVLPPAQGDT